MGMLDKMKALRSKAETAAVEHREELRKAVDKAGQLVDKRTQGKYHDKIDKLTTKADTQLDELTARNTEPPPPSPPAADQPDDK